MASKLNKMSVQEIFAKFGDFLYPWQLKYVVDCMFSFEQYLKENDITPEKIDVIKFVIRNSNVIDKEKLVFCIAKNFKEYMRSSSSKKSTDMQNRKNALCYESFQDCMELLKDSKVEMPVIKSEKINFILTQIEGKEDQKGSLKLEKIEKFENVNDLLSKPQKSNVELKKENQDRWAEIIKEITPRDMFFIQYLEDVDLYISGYKGNASVFKYLVLVNSETILNLTLKKAEESGVDLSDEKINDTEIDIVLKQKEEVMKNNIDKVDLDKFLLLVAYRAKKVLLNEDVDLSEQLSETEIQAFAKVIEIANKHVVNPKAKIAGGVVQDSKGTRKNVEYTAKQLEQDTQRIVNGVYYTQSKIDETKRNILENQMSLAEVTDKKLFDLINFKFKDKEKLVLEDKNNFRVMLNMGVLSEDEQRKLLDKVSEVDYIVLNHLYENEVIGKKDIIDFYVNGKIDLDTIMDVDTMYNVKSQINISELMDYYSNVKKNSDETKKFEQYSVLFNKLYLKSRTPEDQARIYEGIVEEVFKQEGDAREDFLSLYKKDLLPIQTLVDWNDPNIIYDLVVTADLKPKDVKELLKENKLDIKQVKTALELSDLTDEEKINFVFSCFEDIEHSLFLLQAINITEDLKQTSKKTGEKHQRMHKGEKRQERHLNPRLRWELLSLMDEDYSSHTYRDGTTIFTLPNVNGGTVLVEKIFEKRKDELKLTYGAATYWMSESTFLKNKNELIIDKKINRSKLTDMINDVSVEKAYHVKGWGKKLMKTFNIDVKSGYSEEKINRMESISEQLDFEYERQK